MKLALGTVQFGLDYGISNNKKTHLDEVHKILEYSKSVGIDLLDTAASYGDSEYVIGEITKNSKTNFKIITKIPPFQSNAISNYDIQQLELIVHKSLNRLNKEKVYGIMFHNANDLFKEKGILLYKKLLELKDRGYTEKIGFSVYDSNQIDHLCERFEFDIIQLPINVLDQRLLKSGHLYKLKSLGVEIHARSIFLQGLLLMDLNSLPKYFEPIKPILSKYQVMLRENKMTMLDGALTFAKSQKEIDYLVVGVNNLEQLIDIYNSFNRKSNDNVDFSEYSFENINIIDPRNWNEK